MFEVSEGLGGSGGSPGASPGLPGAGPHFYLFEEKGWGTTQGALPLLRINKDSASGPEVGLPGAGL